MSARALLALAGLLLALAASWLVPRLAAAPTPAALGVRLLEEGRPRDAAFLLEDPAWRGIAEHRAGRHRRAVAAFLVRETPDTLYNAGVAYARLHEWGAARAAFGKALRLAPDHADARHNLAVVARAEAAEAAALAESRGDAAGAAPPSGERSGEPGPEAEGGERVEKGDARGEETRAAEAPGDRGGGGEGGELMGEEARSPDARGGAARNAAEGEGPAPDGLSASAAALRRESAQAAEILLRRIEDDPARVLGARLRAARALRDAREAVR